MVHVPSPSVGKTNGPFPGSQQEKTTLTAWFRWSAIGRSIRPIRGIPTSYIIGQFQEALGAEQRFRSSYEPISAGDRGKTLHEPQMTQTDGRPQRLHLTVVSRFAAADIGDRTEALWKERDLT